MQRRTFIVMAGAAVGWPWAAVTQQNPGPATGVRIWRIGVLARRRTSEQLVLGLRNLGYEPGKNLIVEHRELDRPEMLARFAADFVASNVDVIVAGGTQAV